jgi:hypothetical protein
MATCVVLDENIDTKLEALKAKLGKSKKRIVYDLIIGLHTAEFPEGEVTA